VKLLFDWNLSPSLVDSLADIYPESMHVQSVGLDRADDRAIWDFARSPGVRPVLPPIILLVYNNESY